MTTHAPYKADAVWHNFKASDFVTMALGGRLDHPSRGYFYDWLARQSRQSAAPLAWCDVGVLSMVDYENVRASADPDLARVVYCGVEMSEAIAREARGRLRRRDDRVVVGDLEDLALPRTLTDRFDVMSIRHVLNHCRYYEVPLRNALALLRPGGKVFVNLHVRCSDDADRLDVRPLPDVPGSYVENVYAWQPFVACFTSLFALEAVVEIDSRVDGRIKPNEIFIGVKPGLRQDLRPESITILPSFVTRAGRSLRAGLGAFRTSLRGGGERSDRSPIG